MDQRNMLQMAIAGYDAEILKLENERQQCVEMLRELSPDAGKSPISVCPNPSREKRRASAKKRWADPQARQAQGEKIKQAHKRKRAAAQKPEQDATAAA